MTEVFASQRPVYLVALDGAYLLGLGGVQLISGLALSTAWERQGVGVLPGTFLTEPPAATGEWKRENSGGLPSVFAESKG